MTTTEKAASKCCGAELLGDTFGKRCARCDKLFRPQGALRRLEDEICAEFCIEREDMAYRDGVPSDVQYWAPADPGPREFSTLVAALRFLMDLPDVEAQRKAEAWDALQSLVGSWSVSHPRADGDPYLFGISIQLTEAQVRDAVERGGLGWAPLDVAVRNLAASLSPAHGEAVPKAV